MKQKIAFIVLALMALIFIYLKVIHFIHKDDVVETTERISLEDIISEAEKAFEEDQVKPIEVIENISVEEKELVRMGDIKVGDIDVVVEFADTPEKRQKGLSGREMLPDVYGVLFLMEREARHSFWMKDMKFDIDILWINNNEIIDISNNILAPVGDNLPAVVQPSAPVAYVLEVNADFTEKYDIKVGDVVVLTD